MLNIVILADDLKESIFTYCQNTALVRAGWGSCHDVHHVADEPKIVLSKQLTFGQGGGIPIIKT